MWPTKLLFKRMDIIQNDFTTQHDELRTPYANGSDNKHQCDGCGRRIHETPANQNVED